VPPPLSRMSRVPMACGTPTAATARNPGAMAVSDTVGRGRTSTSTYRAAAAAALTACPPPSRIRNSRFIASA
jgi:hypothetical protein